MFLFTGELLVKEIDSSTERQTDWQTDRNGENQIEKLADIRCFSFALSFQSL